MILADPDTGELHEVVDATVLANATPYDYAEGRAALFRVSRQHREALAQYNDAIKGRAAAEREYHATLSVEVQRAKVDHGATIAETVAKGTEEVGAASEARIIAEGRVYAAMHLLALCVEDRHATNRMVDWSREREARDA